MKIKEIRIIYEDGSDLILSKWELDKIEKMGEAMNWIQRAKAVYDGLKPLFKNGE